MVAAGDVTGTIRNEDGDDTYHGSAARPGGVLREDRSIGRVEVEGSTSTYAQENPLTTNDGVTLINEPQDGVASASSCSNPGCNIPRGRSVAHDDIVGKKVVYASLDVETGGEFCGPSGLLQLSCELFRMNLVLDGWKDRAEDVRRVEVTTLEDI